MYQTNIQNQLFSAALPLKPLTAWAGSACSVTVAVPPAPALAGLGRYDVVPVVLDADDLSAMPKDVDAAYIALHGGWGENGGVQAALDALKIPYTGPGAMASQIAMEVIRVITENAK